jgi:hypothetical protein
MVRDSLDWRSSINKRSSTANQRLHARDPQIGVIANEIMSRAILPPKASIDALHIALVAHHRIQYLLTWNCKHIANAKILPGIHDLLTDLGCPIPIICTPEEMVDDDSEDI